MYISDTPLVYPFIEYQAYLLARNNTLVVGARAGSLFMFSSWGDGYINADFAPTFGWSWGIGSRKQFGIMPYIGCDLYLILTGGYEGDFYPMPFLGVTFEF